MSTFQLKVVTYNKIFFEGEAQSVTVPALDGEMQLLSNHEECVIGICPGEIVIADKDGKKTGGVCGSGFVHFMVGSNSAEVLVDTIERPEEIDVRRAQEAKERAQEKLRQQQSIMEYYRVETSLARAMARLKVANKRNKI